MSWRESKFLSEEKLKKNRLIKVRIIIALFIIILLTIMFWDKCNLLLRTTNPIKYSEIVKEYSKINNLDPFLVLSIIRTESNFDEKAISNKKARGLMQISEITGKWASKELKIKDYNEDKLFNPKTNIQVGCWYFAKLMKEFKNQDLAIAAYNGGSGNVKEWIKKDILNYGPSLPSSIPFRETSDYLKKVKKTYSIYQSLYEKNN